jgi:hypothetical protein
MGFQYRKSKKIGPMRFTVSKRGVGYSVGGKGFRVTKRADGRIQQTVSVPGTGMRWVSTSGHAHRATAVPRPHSNSSAGTSGALVALFKFLWMVSLGAILAFGLFLVAGCALVIPSQRARARGFAQLAQRALMPWRPAATN